jgi:sirohydrochlorin cobaltochelatase
MNNKKKLLIASIFLGAAAFLPINQAEAAYTLSSEVKTATPALMNATEIGTLSYTNPNMKSSANKDAILIMSFGTTYKETRAKNIDATINAIQKANPNLKVMTSFTSHIIIDRIKKKEGKTYPTPEEALKQLKNEGYTRVALVSLDIIPGIEYGYKRGVYEQAKKDFKSVSLGTSLLYWQGQEDQRDDIEDFIKALASDIKTNSKDEAVLLMAHGTPQPANAYYSVIQAKLNEMGYDNVYVYTVEGWPNLETVMPKLKAKGIKKVKLQPIMMVAGDHATNDMSGDEPDSHKNIFKKEGFSVSVVLKGLGENTNIQNMYVARAKEAVDALK